MSLTILGLTLSTVIELYGEGNPIFLILVIVACEGPLTYLPVVICSIVIAVYATLTAVLQRFPSSRHHIFDTWRKREMQVGFEEF